MSAEFTSTEVALDGRLWQLYSRGLAEGMTMGYGGGYAAGVRDEAAAYAAEWAACREKVRGITSDPGLRERRGGDLHAAATERARRGWAPLAGGADPGWPA